MSTFAKLRTSLKKAKAIQATAKTPDQRQKAASVVSKLNRAVRKARANYYKKLGL
jgi:hypothetical protein